MTPEELKAAESRICARPEYAWLCSTTQDWFNVSEIATSLHLARDTVRKMVEASEFPGSIRFTETSGWRIPRSGLVEYFARKLGFSGQQAG